MFKRMCNLLLCLVLFLGFITGCNLDLSLGTGGLFGEADLVVQYLDVGQGDAAIIKFPDSKIMLIDAGPNSCSNSLVEYIEDQDIIKIDYLIVTHPHEDHIGGMIKVIEHFEIDEMYMPKVDDSQVPTTRVYEDFLSAVDEKGLMIDRAQAGEIIVDEDNIKVEFLGPNSESYKLMNNYSAVVKLTYGEKKFLFMGDAESESENEILNKFDVEADVIKCGHHGSSSSSKKDFIKAVAPSYAIISCGEGNLYGHPHSKTLKVLEDNRISVYRTDLDKTITAVCNGEEIEIKTGGIDLS